MLLIRDGAILWLWGAVAPPKIWEKNYYYINPRKPKKISKKAP